MDNRAIAEHLLNYAHYLEAREANLYRVQAYRRAAQSILSYPRPIEHLLEERGRDGLEELPGIGSHLSYTIETLLRTGEFRTLGRDEGHIDAEQLFISLPGVGPRLARQICEGLGIQTLEQLEQAAHEGRLAELQVGRKRLRGIMDALAGRFQRGRLVLPPAEEPSVAELLAVDQDYRLLAERGALPTFAPRRFNAENEPWLPMLETERNRWQYRALYSNTAVAHRLNQTHDWVVVYFEKGLVSGQRTIVTERRGDLSGRRVVRGRERECREHYAGQQAEPEAAGMLEF